MGINNIVKKLAAKERPYQIDVKAESDSSGTDILVVEHFAKFTGHYADGTMDSVWQKYGGTKTDITKMNKDLDSDIAELEACGFIVQKLNEFQNE
ncbi:hypothetical protein KY346_02140 [Candidatus Woesearchaeota archaeon]|nr:hypothetical protein [Candidatus Woesearchaeota archaeon]